MGGSVRYLYSDLLVSLVTIVDDLGWGRGGLAVMTLLAESRYGGLGGS